MKRVNPKSIENLQPRYAPDRPGETVALGIRLRKDQRDKLNEISTARQLAIGVLIREAVDSYLSQLPGTVSEKPCLSGRTSDNQGKNLSAIPDSSDPD